MSIRHWKTRLQDILISIQNIEIFTESMDELTFIQDAKTIRACAFEFSVIGEAIRVLPAEILSNFPNIPWGKIQSMRNKIIHEYFRIDEEILWNSIKEDLPKLKYDLMDILKRES